MKKSFFCKIPGDNCCIRCINRELVKLKRALDELSTCFNSDCCKKNKKKC